MNARRQRSPWRGSRPRDVTCQTRTLATPGADATASRLLASARRRLLPSVTMISCPPESPERDVGVPEPVPSRN